MALSYKLNISKKDWAEWVGVHPKHITKEQWEVLQHELDKAITHEVDHIIACMLDEYKAGKYHPVF